MSAPGLATEKLYKNLQPRVPILKGKGGRSGWRRKREGTLISITELRGREIRLQENCRSVGYNEQHRLPSPLCQSLVLWTDHAFEKCSFITFCLLKCYTILTIVQESLFPYKRFMVHCNTRCIPH